MSKTQHQRIVATKLPQLAAMVVFFLGVSAANAPLDATPTVVGQSILPILLEANKKSISEVAKEKDVQIHVLSESDATLYRSAFAAQDKGDWISADVALASLKDKRLIGHILADRYLRRDMSLAEAQQWMSDYADFPEAAAIYGKSTGLRGFAFVHITPPVAVVAWSGNSGDSTLTGFHVKDELTASSDRAVIRIDSKINNALHHGDPMKARDLLTSELQRGTISIKDAAGMTSRIAANFFYEGETERARAMAHLAADQGSPLGLWIDGLSAWKQQDFVSSTRSFASLAQAPGLSPWDRAAASFWAYRAAKRTGDTVQARHWLAEAAKTPGSFYGTMAASLANNSPIVSWKMPDLSTKNMDTLAQRPAGLRALALVQVGRTDLAEIELRHMNPLSSRSLQTAVLALAEHAHMPSLTLQLGGVATNDNGQHYEAAMYPLPPWQPVSGFKVDRALIYALVKHESQFHPNAVSGRGACGLMQIMPSTARQFSNDNLTGNDCPNGLFDPATNLEMGQKYVRVLSEQPMIGDNLLLLLAAYNGGPGNLSHWLDNDNRTDPLMFVESMPVRETRDYVQQVLLQYWMYRARLSESETSVAELARGEWPRYALNDNGSQHAATHKTEVVASR